MVAHWATSPQYLVVQTCFLVVPGVRTVDLSGPETPNSGCREPFSGCPGRPDT